MDNIIAINGKVPKIANSAFIAPNAYIIGDVEIGENASIWYNCVLRGDTNSIKIGSGSNIQDGTIIHADENDKGGCPVIIGEHVLVGHKCLLHGVNLHDWSFVGMGATMLDHTIIEAKGFLGAGSLLTYKKIIKSYELWTGRPACFVRKLKNIEEISIEYGVNHYIKLAKEHKKLFT